MLTGACGGTLPDAAGGVARRTVRAGQDDAGSVVRLDVGDHLVVSPAPSASGSAAWRVTTFPVNVLSPSAGEGGIGFDATAAGLGRIVLMSEVQGPAPLAPGARPPHRVYTITVIVSATSA